MEINEDIVIVGAGIGGLATSLGLHRYIKKKNHTKLLISKYRIIFKIAKF